VETESRLRNVASKLHVDGLRPLAHREYNSCHTIYHISLSTIYLLQLLPIAAKSLSDFGEEVQINAVFTSNFELIITL
jgi:hypothetical protein